MDMGDPWAPRGRPWGPVGAPWGPKGPQGAPGGHIGPPLVTLKVPIRCHTMHCGIAFKGQISTAYGEGG